MSIKPAAGQRDAFIKLKTINERTISTDDGKEIKCLSADPRSKKGGYLLHLSVDTPGEQASIVPNTDHESINAEIGILNAPEEAEFMDGDAFIYIKGNHLCLCSTLFRDKTINLFLYNIFKAAKIRADSNQFDLLKVADIDKVKMIHEEKVKEIEIRGSLYKASSTYARRKSETLGLLGGVAKLLRSMSKNENDVTDDSLRVALTIKTDERSKGSLTLGEKRIEDLAVNLVEHLEEDDDFIIITKTGKKIGPKELFVRRNIDIKGHGKSVDKTEAWKVLVLFYLSLEESGVVET